MNNNHNNSSQQPRGMKWLSLSLFAALFCAMFGTQSCNKSSESAADELELTSTIDSLSYYIGVAQSLPAKEYFNQITSDTTKIDEFIAGITDGLGTPNPDGTEAYKEGVNVSGQIKGMAEMFSSRVFGENPDLKIDATLMTKGIVRALSGAEKMDPMDAGALADSLVNVVMEKEYSDWKALNDKYLADNMKADSIVALPSGVQYKIINAGSGEPIAADAKVKVHYEGKDIEGNVFDSSYMRGEPIEIDMANPGVIEGWVEILKLMPQGAKWEVTIPQDKAYGSMVQSPIKPFSTLIFTMEIVK